jgi:hypothetical protein
MDAMAVKVGVDDFMSKVDSHLDVERVLIADMTLVTDTNRGLR